MDRDEVWHVARAAARVLGVRRVLVIGSQAVWGSLDVAVLPAATTMSEEADIAAIDMAVSSEESAMLISGAIGQGSTFHDTNAYYADGVELTTATLPPRWEGRVISRRVDTDVHGDILALFPEIHDLCIAKLAAGRPKDHRFVESLVAAAFVDPVVLAERAASVVLEGPGEARRVLDWLGRYEKGLSP